MTWWEYLTTYAGLTFVVVGVAFFTAGTIGLVRFPDIRNQLHAVTKADNLGLGLVLLGCGVLIGSWTTGLVLLLTWLMALGASSVSAQLIAQTEAPSESPEGNARRDKHEGVP